MAFEVQIAQKVAQLLASGFNSGFPLGFATTIGAGELQVFEHAN